MKALILILLVTVNYAFATDQLILTSTNDFDKLITKTFVETNEKLDAVALVHQTYQQGKIIKSIRITPQLAQDWVDLDNKLGRVIAKLKGVNFSSANGGTSIISYLSSGVTNSWRQVEFDLRRNGDIWSVYHNREQVSGIKFYAKRVPILGIIGIKRVVFH